MCDHSLESLIEQYLTVVLFVFQLYPVCNFKKILSILDLALSGVKGLKKTYSNNTMANMQAAKRFW